MKHHPIYLYENKKSKFDKWLKRQLAKGNGESEESEEEVKEKKPKASKPAASASSARARPAPAAAPRPQPQQKAQDIAPVQDLISMAPSQPA